MKPSNRSRAPIFSVVIAAQFALSETSHASFGRPELSSRGMVASPHALATEAGLTMLKRGGNAVDAAVAVAFAISVTLPYSAGIGGGGFLLFHEGKTGEISALDFRERAPLAASRDMYVDEDGQVKKGAPTDGHLSVAVPGTVAGLFEVHHARGKLPWRDVVAPAIALAHDGFVVSELYEGFAEWRREPLEANAAARAIFLKPDGSAFQRGELLVQRDLAETLRRIARDPSDFYEGKIAYAIVDDMTKNGGLVTLEDLKSYRPVWRAPVCGTYRGHRVCSMPPPSSGGVHIVQMLNMLEPTDIGANGWHSVDSMHVMAEVMRTAYADRATHLGDPAFVSVPVRGLTDRTYADERRREIPLDRARKSTDVKAGSKDRLTRPVTVGPKEPAMMGKKTRDESPNTSHLTVVDGEMNAVSLTFTVNYGFGSGVVAPGTGILLNDEMDDFSSAPGQPNAYGLIGGEANAIAPAKIPLSSMTPTIVTKDGQFAFATGSPGGSTIITTSLQVVVNVIDHGLDARAAVAAPRMHHQWMPDELKVERGHDVGTLEALRKHGHTVVETENWGNASCIKRRPDGTLEGSADPRGEGTALGW
jgi:gamma-glutamyltranspeptidase/glutathione hydrolase